MLGGVLRAPAGVEVRLLPEPLGLARQLGAELVDGNHLLVEMVERRAGGPSGRAALPGRVQTWVPVNGLTCLIVPSGSRVRYGVTA